jgi:hypothetical protein
MCCGANTSYVHFFLISACFKLVVGYLSMDSSERTLYNLPLAIIEYSDTSANECPC